MHLKPKNDFFKSLDFKPFKPLRTTLMYINNLYKLSIAYNKSITKLSKTALHSAKKVLKCKFFVVGQFIIFMLHLFYWNLLFIVINIYTFGAHNNFKRSFVPAMKNSAGIRAKFHRHQFTYIKTYKTPANLVYGISKCVHIHMYIYIPNTYHVHAYV